MKKTDFKLKVRTIKESKKDYDNDEELIQGMIADGYHLTISAWDGDAMVDQHITDEFPELVELGIEELAEGDMLYGGTHSKHSLAEILRTKGFNLI